MKELSFIEILKYVGDALLSSKVFILVILEALILVVSFIFKRLMNKRIVKRTSIIASLVVFGFYISNYYHTLITFINNVSVNLIELIYFPTTLEFMIIMVVSFLIMLATLLNKKKKWLIKAFNTVIPLIISFLFLSIIEYISTNNILFDEFSVFSNPILMSLYELAMGIFISWIIILIVIKVDKVIISLIDNNEEELKENGLTVSLPDGIDALDDIELPKLKEN